MPDGMHTGSALRVTEHRGADDLLFAGLPRAALASADPPAVVDAHRPTAAEQRRRAIWSNWRGLADPRSFTGFDALAPVPGREFHALLRLPGRVHPHRVMLQLPDDFDAESRCLLVTASSGSRGIYGALAIAGGWGLPRGCAVAYTDKGTGTDWYDAQAGIGIALDGTPTDDPARMAFAPAQRSDQPEVLIRHAHSGDNPEADWGRHLRQAAEFGLAMLDRARPAEAPFTFENTRVIAVGVSNGGGAALRAAADPRGWLRGVVAASSNVLPPQGGRALYDYGTEAALYMLAAQAAPELGDLPWPTPLVPLDAIGLRSAEALAALRRHALIDCSGDRATAAAALRHLRITGWTDAALHAAALSTALDMWRALGVLYSSAYGGFGSAPHPLGYRTAPVAADGSPRRAEAAERASWWSLSAGVVPGAGVGIVDPHAAAGDVFAGLLHLRAGCIGRDAASRRIQAGIAATRAALPPPRLPMLLMHGIDDGLIPERFATGAYVDACRRAGRSPVYWRLPGVQHFDAFLGLPAFAARYRPLLPYVHRGLDAMCAHLLHGRGLPVRA